MIFSTLFSPCLFGHDHPVKVLQGKVLHFQCPRCLADLGSVLAGQQFKKRKVKKPRTRRSADVLRPATFRKGA
jgi:hypothetical protein